MLSPSGVNQLQEEQRGPQVPEGISEVFLLSSQNWLKCNLKVSIRGGFLMDTETNGCVSPWTDFVASDFPLGCSIHHSFCSLKDFTL